MPTFIDESGDTGPGMKSARFFRLVAVCFEHSEAIPAFSDDVDSLRGRLGLPQMFEFHFSHINHKQKVAFLEMATAHPFVFVASCYEKDSFDRKTLSKEVIRQTTIDGLVRHLGECFRLTAECRGEGRHLNERIIYDECNDPSYVADLKKSFSRALGGNHGAGKSYKARQEHQAGQIEVRPLLAVGRYGLWIGQFIPGGPELLS